MALYKGCKMSAIWYFILHKRNDINKLTTGIIT